MIFNKIFNKKNVRSLAGPFAAYLFFGIFIFPFFSKGNVDKNPFEQKNSAHSSTLSNSDLWFAADIVLRISEKPITGAKVFQNLDSNYLLRFSICNATFSLVYYQVDPPTSNIAHDNFSQSGPRSPPAFL